MSNFLQLLESLNEERSVGFTDDEKKALVKFELEGKPRIAEASRRSVEIKDLYFKGYALRDICGITRIPKAAILCLIYTEGWAAELHNENLAKLETISSQMQRAKIETAYFMTEMIDFIHKYYRDRIKLYNENKNNSVLEDTDFRLMSVYKNFLDNLKITGNSGGNPQTPTVHINAGEGSTVTVKNVEPSETDSAKLLEVLADMKRQKAKTEGKK